MHEVCVKAGKQIGPIQGHDFIINKALHGLRTSGLQWNEKLNDYLRDMGHEPCEMELDMWINDCGDHY